MIRETLVVSAEETESQTGHNRGALDYLMEFGLIIMCRNELRHLGGVRLLKQSQFPLQCVDV